MRVGKSYRQHDIVGNYDAIVIGSGIGGLTVAALLARHGGKRVLVLERHYTAGGFTHTFHRPGYDWDVGVHYIGQVTDRGSPVLQVFDEVTGHQLQWADMGEIYDKIVIGDDSYELVKGKQRFQERMLEYFPSEREAIERYLERVIKTVQKGGLFFAEKSIPQPLSRIIGGAMRWSLLREARKTTRQVLSELTGNARLMGVLTGQYGDYGLPPGQSSFFIHALIAGHYLEGAAYPVGGSSRIAATITAVIESAAGAVFTNAEVGSILIEGERAVGVRLADGNEIRAPLVISDAGATNTYLRLLPVDSRSRLGLDRLVERHRPSAAHVSLYIGLRTTARELGLEKTNLWIYPHHDHDRNLERFFKDQQAPLPVAYISFPSAKDPDFEKRHPGRSTIEVVTLVPYAWFQQWESEAWKKRSKDYEELKTELTERLLEPLHAHCPQVRGKIDYAELSTPLSTRHFAGHPRGEIYGLAATPEHFCERWLRPQTPVKRLYLTGADVCTLGVVGAMFGGLLSASAILGRDLRRSIAKHAT